MDKQSRRQQLYSLLGDLPERRGPLHAETVAVEERADFVLEKLVLELNGREPVPAYFVRPQAAQGRRPTILYNHSHGGDYTIGKDELLNGRIYLKQPAYAGVLAQRGYNALCIDAWMFGERRGRSEGETFREMLWKGEVLWGMMVYDSLRAVDYLVSRPDVDADRIGTLGISMGSTMAWWLSALDTRLKVCVDLCCMTDFHALIAARGLDHHGLCVFVPGLLKYFTTAQINALIAPRPHLCLAGNFDVLTPPAGLDRVDSELKAVYQDEGAAQAWRMLRYNCGHLETWAMRREVVAFLERWL